MDNSGGISSGGMTSGGAIQGADMSMENSFEQAPVMDQPEKFEAIIADDPIESNINKSDSDKIMDIPGTAHDKLEGLSEMSDEEIDNLSIGQEDKDSFIDDQIDMEMIDDKDEDAEEEDQGVKEAYEPKKLSFEEEIIKLQAETMKLMAEKMNSGKVDKGEYEQLLKRLKKLLNNAEEEEDGKKASLMIGILAVITMLTQLVDDGVKKLENEVERAQG